MASSRTTDEKQNLKQNLADFIKSVHGNLRQEVYEANGDFESVWKEHCSNTSLLRKYSTSMKELAVEHWGENNLRRMEWCKNVCVEYFFEGGCEKCLKKDCRRILFNLEQHQDCGCLPEAEDLRLKLNSNNYQERDCKIILLDVGSCFNPFKAFSDFFIPLAIDLCPADEAVLACDFLCLDIVNGSNVLNKNASAMGSMNGDSCLPEQIRNCIENGCKISQLPQNSFDVVVFCLLLSYLPAKVQRWTCCTKAHKLLKDNGLLILVTPDSSHQNKNMAMIKSWKTAIESIGFLRWKYHKDDHTHCMAFRKIQACNSWKTEEDLSEMLYIHQDLDGSI